MLQDRTIPADATAIESSGVIRRDSTSATASWSFETDQVWEAYITWVTGNLPNYASESTEANLRLVRRLPGDVFELQIERPRIDKDGIIRVNFRAYAQ